MKPTPDKSVPQNRCREHWSILQAVRLLLTTWDRSCTQPLSDTFAPTVSSMNCYIKVEQTIDKSVPQNRCREHWSILQAVRLLLTPWDRSCTQPLSDTFAPTLSSMNCYLKVEQTIDKSVPQNRCREHWSILQA